MIKKLLIMFITLAITFLSARNLGICTKVKGNILRQGSVRDGYVRKGDSIYHGDKIITDGSGFMSFVLINNEAVVSVLNNAVIRIFGDDEISEDEIDIALFGGKVIIDMQNRSSKKLILDAPSTQIITDSGYFMCEYNNNVLFDNFSYSIVTVLKGKAEILNTTSGSSIYMSQGETIVSTLGGKFLELEAVNSGTLIENTLRAE